MPNLKENKTLSKTTLLTVIFILMVSSANLLHYLSESESDVSIQEISAPLPSLTPKTVEEIKPNKENIQPKQVKIILRVLPKEVLFDLSMQKPEVLSLAKSESGEVQMMVEEGVQYEFRVSTQNGKEEIVELEPSGEIEVHYDHF